MAKVFVSYSRKDIEFAKRLTTELQKSDLDFWIDWEGIPPTVDWWREIEKGIEEADAFLFLISPDSSVSKVCGQEIDTAVKNAKRIIPLVVRDVKSDDVSKQLSHLNWIFFRETDDFDAAFKKLSTAIHTDYEWVQQHRWLQVRALDWERDHKDKSSLLRGKDLQDVEFQLATNSSKEPHPTDLQREYVFSSRKAADQQRNITVGIAITGIIILAALAVWGWGQAGLATLNANESERNASTAQAAKVTAEANLVVANTAQANAENQKATAVASENEAKKQAEIALARQWAADANAILASPNGNAETAALLSLRAFQVRDEYVPSADAALVASLNRLFIVKVFDQHNSKVSAVAFSPKGNQVGIGYVDGTAGLYDVYTGDELQYFEGFDGPGYYFDLSGSPEYEGVHTISFSVSGNYMLVAGRNGHIVVWNLGTGKTESDFTFQDDLILWSAKFSPDEKYILIGTGYPHRFAGNIFLLEMATGELKYTLPQFQTRFISDVEFSTDGRMILSTSFDGTAILLDMDWDTLTVTPRQPFTSAFPFRDGAISPDGKFVLLGGDNGMAELYSIDGNLQKQFAGHTNTIYSVNFSPLEGYILTGSLDGTARLWDIQSGKTIRAFVNHKDSVVSTDFSFDGKYMITGSFDNTARIWLADPTHDVQTIYGHTDRVNTVSYSPDGLSILSASRDNSVRLWNAKTLEFEDRIQLSDSLLDPKAVFSSDGKWIAAASEAYQKPNPNIVFWEQIGSTYPNPITTPTDHISSLAFSPSPNGGGSEYLVTSYEDGQLDLWQNVGGNWNVTETIIYPYSGPSFSTVMFTSDSKYLASMNGYILIINMQDPNEVPSGCVTDLFSGTTYDTRAIAFSPDSKYLAVQVDNDVVILDWKTDQGQGCTLVDRLKGHLAPVTGLTFSPNGNYLLSTSQDGIAILWDAKTWQQVRVLAGHEGEITSAAFSPDNNSIVTGGKDKTIRVWDTNYKDTVELVCSFLKQIDRDFTDEERAKYGITDNNATCGK